MGKKMSAREKVEAARANGFDDDDMVSIDDRPVLRDVLEYTSELYKAQMEMWRE